MKTLKFYPHYVAAILDGTKTVTWRLFDDKDLQVGDELSLVIKAAAGELSLDGKESSEEFAKATITAVREKPLGEINAQDLKEHGPLGSRGSLLDSFRKMYGPAVTKETMVKIVTFRLV